MRDLEGARQFRDLITLVLAGPPGMQPGPAVERRAAEVAESRGPGVLKLAAIAALQAMERADLGSPEASSPLLQRLTRVRFGPSSSRRCGETVLLVADLARGAAVGDMRDFSRLHLDLWQTRPGAALVDLATIIATLCDWTARSVGSFELALSQQADDGTEWRPMVGEPHSAA